ncbi:DUF1484 family protein [Cupriavidus sp. SK-4]|uniref:DUF1484 family protein n=1 Tax=Cupriavidus sp. SK-4 TaxID=574750 RepID=UPI000565A717
MRRSPPGEKRNPSTATPARSRQAHRSDQARYFADHGYAPLAPPVSSGLRASITHLEVIMQIDTMPQGIGLHALLLPLKQQLDESANRLQALV